jgi:hypothetical protein
MFALAMNELNGNLDKTPCETWSERFGSKILHSKVVIIECGKCVLMDFDGSSFYPQGSRGPGERAVSLSWGNYWNVHPPRWFYVVVYFSRRLFEEGYPDSRGGVGRKLIQEGIVSPLPRLPSGNGYDSTAFR